MGSIEVTVQKSFDDWFQGSKVTNPDGSPRVVFHGTQAVFESFNTPSWFSPSERYADLFSADWGDLGCRDEASRVVPVYLNFKNPYFTNDWDVTEDLAMRPEWVAEMTAKGFDSVIFSLDGEVEFIAFTPEQIILATDPRAPQSEFSNYAGTDGGLKFKNAEQEKPNTLLFTKLSPWIVIDGYCATRVIEGSDPGDVANRIAFIEKTPRVLHGGSWVEGPNGSGGGDPASDGTYGFDANSRAWCDEYLVAAGAVLSHEMMTAKQVRRQYRP